EKSYGVEALILLGSGAPSSEPCFPGVLSLSFFLFVTIWVTSLGSVLRRGYFAESPFYPIFSRSPNGSLCSRLQTRTRPGAWLRGQSPQKASLLPPGDSFRPFRSHVDLPLFRRTHVSAFNFCMSLFRLSGVAI